MRLKLFLSFTLIILISVTSVVLIVRHNTVNEVRQYVFRGGMMGLNNMVINLEECYQQTRTWDACTSILQDSNRPPTMTGRMMGRKTGNSPNSAMGPAHVQLLDQDGVIITGTGPDPSGVGTRAPSLDGAIPLRSRDEVIGYLLPDSPFNFSPQNESVLIQRLNRAAITAASISGIAALILAAALGYHLLQPVQSLTKAAENIEKGDFSQRVDISGTGKLATLGQVFNQMARAIEESAERRKTLTADIAHELRTPLSVQQAHLEALEDGVYDLTLENLHPIQEQNLTLVRLVDDLQTLSLADSGQLTLEQTPTNVNQLVERILHRFQPACHQKEVTVRYDPPGKPIMANIDPQRVEQIILNLLSNALHHSPRGKSIRVQLHSDEDDLKLTVLDHGEGIPEEEIPYIFERFYKSSQTREREDGGTGLGLSISQKLVQAHDGSIQVQNNPRGGAEFRLELPRIS